MDKESKSGGGLPGNGIIAVVLLVTGALFVREIPLETNRPMAGEAPVAQHFSLQDVDARLWQDPFGAVARGREKGDGAGKDGIPESQRRSVKSLVDAIEQRRDATAEPRPVEILAVMLASGPYSDSIESRRRARYAVLAGLSMSRLAPDDNEHLGYFFPALTDGLDARSLPASDACFAKGTQPPPLPEVVPYEWFEAAPDAVVRDGEGPPPPVLVLWLQSEAFAEAPLRQMCRLVAPFRATGATWRVMGPYGSEGLKAMVDEAASVPGLSRLSDGVEVRFYSHYATVPDRVLLKRVVSAEDPDNGKPGQLSRFFESKGVHLVRTIGDDTALANQLVAELKLRGLNATRLKEGLPSDHQAIYGATCRPDGVSAPGAPSHIAVVAEWDSLYGRSLRREFMARSDDEGFCVDRFNYVRGLDGQLPASSGAGEPGAGAGVKQTSTSDKDATRRKDGTFVERAEGQSQFDYLRRLAVQMHAKDLRVRKSSPDGLGLRAIGVLGNDVHDKLVVLQALQPEFPNVIFFTTDLDARMLHPREQAWARNLVVASNFGLSLAPNVQGGAPPFRDSYQTSAFVTARLAMDDARRKQLKAWHDEPVGQQPLKQEAILKWFQAPRLFEIGRTTAFDFSQEVAGPTCNGRNWPLCTVHPQPSERYPRVRGTMKFMTLGLAVLALWAPALLMARNGRRMLVRFVAAAPDGSQRLARYGVLLLGLVLLQIALPLALTPAWDPVAKWLTHDGKPLVALEGISLWPTEGIRLFALLLCIYLVARGWIMLSNNLDEICLKFRLGKTRREVLAEQEAIDGRLPWWERLFSMFSTSFMPPSAPASRPGHGVSAATLDFWRRHIVQNRLSARFARTAACVLLMLPFSYLLVHALGEDAFVPFRGEVSRRVHQVLCVLSVGVTYFLVFFVVDATVLCVRFVNGLRVRASSWPPSVVESFGRQMSLPAAYLDNWIDLQFIAQRTRCVTGLIYYPFIVLSLLLASRSAALDHWSITLSTMLLASACAAIAICCALALRRAAETSRKVGLSETRDALMRVHAKAAVADDAPTIHQLELLHARIESLHEGAFAPFWQQPMLKAMLLPFATLGGTTVLDYMALANL